MQIAEIGIREQDCEGFTAVGGVQRVQRPQDIRFGEVVGRGDRSKQEDKVEPIAGHPKAHNSTLILNVCHEGTAQKIAYPPNGWF